MTQPQILRCPHCGANYSHTWLAKYTDNGITECPDCMTGAETETWIDADPDLSESN